MIQDIDYAAIAPPLILAVAAIGLLLADAFDAPRRVLSLLSGGSLAAALVAVIALAAATAAPRSASRTACAAAAPAPAPTSRTTSPCCSRASSSAPQ
ncbi:hypothetical protein [Actinomadura madurae]|uniref:hypothetical protein n=1 Tax=Actinomadura madurae TaxID=1993 RepID=UPI0020D23E66|nr:hypothetical protein [Actinomadura madurae]MCP9969668.1 hypothetical protein [Actinomadura madurae]MCQ0018368.1 hypothetical protein [Actinomadura madurae]